MNYSKNLRKRAIAQRIIALWVIVAVVFFLVGVLIGYALKTHITAKDKQKEETQTSEQVTEKTIVYGRMMTALSHQKYLLIGGVGDLDFTPLDCAMPDDEQEFLYYLCAGYNIDFTLVMALIQHESSFDPDAISVTNDYGYMQINEMNHEWLAETLGVTDFLDPYENTRAGCYILRKLFERYQDTEKVLMAYNMGEDAAARLWKKGVYSSAYTESVLAIQADFNEQLEGE